MNKKAILNGMSEAEFYKLYPTEESYRKAMGGSLSGAPHNGQPTAAQFYNEGFIPQSPVSFYQFGGNTPEAFPQQPTPSQFYNEGFIPDSPVGFYEMGGVPCMDCGGNMKQGGQWIQNATKNMRKDHPCTGSKFGGKDCPPGSKRYNLAKTFRAMAKKQYGGDTEEGASPDMDQDTFLENYKNTFMNKIKQNNMMHIADEAASQMDMMLEMAFGGYIPTAQDGKNIQVSMNPATGKPYTQEEWAALQGSSNKGVTNDKGFDIMPPGFNPNNDRGFGITNPSYNPNNDRGFDIFPSKTPSVAPSVAPSGDNYGKNIQVSRNPATGQLYTPEEWAALQASGQQAPLNPGATNDPYAGMNLGKMTTWDYQGAPTPQFSTPESVGLQNKDPYTTTVMGDPANNGPASTKAPGKWNNFSGIAAAEGVLGLVRGAKAFADQVQYGQDANNRKDDYIADKQMAFAPANRIQNQGRHNWTGMSNGMIDPNSMGVIYQPGQNYTMDGYYAQMGGGIPEGQEIELDEDQINQILANGGSVKFLD